MTMALRSERKRKSALLLCSVSCVCVCDENRNKSTKWHLPTVAHHYFNDVTKDAVTIPERESIFYVCVCTHFATQQTIDLRFVAAKPILQR